MGKKVVFAVFGGIALLGLVMSIVGWCLGGRPANVQIDEGSVVYTAAGQSRVVGHVPQGVLSNGRFWLNRYVDHDYEYAYAYEDEYDDTDDYMDHENSSHTGSWLTSGEEVRVDYPKQEIPIDVPAASLINMVADVDAGYLVIKQGDTPGLTVQGPMMFQTEYEDGEWKLESEEDIDRIYTEDRDGTTRFYRNGEDVTTVFTLTVPKNLPYLYAELDLGVMTVKQIEDAGEIYLSLDLGEMQVEDCRAVYTGLNVELGAITAKGVKTETADLAADLGAITFSGEITDELTGSCNMGAIQVQMPRPADGYYCDTNVGLGAIDVDGHTTAMPDGAESFGVGDETLQMYLNCDMGSIEVDFN